MEIIIYIYIVHSGIYTDIIPYRSRNMENHNIRGNIIPTAGSVRESIKLQCM